MTTRAPDLTRFAPPPIAGARTTAALHLLVDENLILRLKLALHDPATADLPGLEPLRFAFDQTEDADETA